MPTNPAALNLLGKDNDPACEQIVSICIGILYYRETMQEAVVQPEMHDQHIENHEYI